MSFVIARDTADPDIALDQQRGRRRPLPWSSDEQPGVSDWTAVCRYDDPTTPERGVTALLDGHQVALFRTVDGMLRAVDNRDPKSGANVLSRGIAGTSGDVARVTSPPYKQVFDLRTRRCPTGTDAADGTGAVTVHEVRRTGDLVEVRVSG